jgi:hypothetical protein
MLGPMVPKIATTISNNHIGKLSTSHTILGEKRRQHYSRQAQHYKKIRVNKKTHSKFCYLKAMAAMIEKSSSSEKARTSK